MAETRHPYITSVLERLDGSEFVLASEAAGVIRDLLNERGEIPGLIRGTCAACGLPGHRYGTTDDSHAYDATACINGLRGVIEDLSRVVGQLGSEWT